MEPRDSAWLLESHPLSTTHITTCEVLNQL